MYDTRRIEYGRLGLHVPVGAGTIRVQSPGVVFASYTSLSTRLGHWPQRTLKARYFDAPVRDLSDPAAFK